MEQCINPKQCVNINFIFKIIVFVIFKTLNIQSLNATVVMVTNSSEITSVMSSAQPGDTLIMQNGIWTNQIINFGGANGVNGNPIVLMAQTLGQVYMEGSSRLKIYGNHLEVNGIIFRNPTPASLGTNHIIEFRNGSTLANNCRITNIEISYYNSDNSVDNKWVSLYGTYNIVDQCKFEGKSNYGPVMVVWYQNAGGFPNESPSTYHLVENNYFLNRTLPLGGNGGETIRVGDSNTSRTNGHNIFQYNLFEHCDGEIEIISNKSEYNIYRYNTFRENSGQLTLRHGAFCIVEGNYFLGNNYAGSSGVRIIDSSHIVRNNYFEALSGGNQGSLRAPITIMNGDINPAANGYWPVRQCSIYNNTIVNCIAPSMRIGVAGDIVPGNCYIYNNLFYGNNGPFIENTSVPINIQYNNNVYFGASLGITNGGFINLDPLLTNIGPGGLYRLTQNSPIIDGGLSDPLFEDMDGQSRMLLPDIGSDEYSAQSINRLPLVSDNVGPCWLSSIYMCVNIPLAIKGIKFSGYIKENKAFITVKCNNNEICQNYQLEKYNYHQQEWIVLSAVTFNDNWEFVFTDNDVEYENNTYRISDLKDFVILDQLNLTFKVGKTKLMINNNYLHIDNRSNYKIKGYFLYSMEGKMIHKLHGDFSDEIIINLESYPKIFILRLLKEVGIVESRILIR